MVRASHSTISRSEAILDSIRAVFIERGFEGASMQALARAAGMSAGNFYSYFPSKEAIVEAMIERDLRQIHADIDEIASAEDPRAAFLALVARECADTRCGSGAMMLEIEAAASRNPAAAAALERFEHALHAGMVGLLHRFVARAGSRLPADPVAEAELIIALISSVMGRSCRVTNEHQRAQVMRLADGIVGLIDDVIERVIRRASTEPASSR